MIPIGLLLAEPDTGLKILTPWWDVLAHYLTAAIMTIALTSTALQAALDNLICIPAVDCSEFLNDPLAVWNKTLPNNNLLGDICSKGKPMLNSSQAILMTTMSDRRQYDFIDSMCYRKVLPWFSAFFPFIIFSQAVFFLLIDNFWSKMPKTSSTLNHFVALVMECYNAEATLSDVLKEIASEADEEDEGEDLLSGKVAIKPEKEPLMDTPDKEFKSEVHENEDRKDSQREETTPSPSNAVKIKALYEKVGAFKRRYKSTYTLLRVYKLRAVSQSIMCCFALTINFLYYSMLRNTVQCQLQQVFITDYEFFQCSRFIAPFYRAVVLIIAIPVVMCLGTSFYALCWVFYYSRDAKVKTNLDTSESVRIRGDMSLLFFLLNEYDQLYSNRLAAFLSKEKRKKIDKKLTLVHRKSLHRTMIVLGQTPQPDAALKILTPWWDVLCRYLTGAIMTIALTATAIQAAKDNLVCIPAVDCTRSISPRTPTALKLKSDVCDQVQYHVINNDTTTTVMTVMSDYRSYAYVDSECFQKNLKWYPAYFPFILVVEALILLVIDNFWIMYPKTSATLNHFVSLVTDCYKSVGTLSDIIEVISNSEKRKGSPATTTKETSPKEPNVEDIEMAFIDPGKTPKPADEPSGSQTPQVKAKQDVATLPFDMSEAIKVKTLYERVENFKNWHEGAHTLMKVYVFRGVIQVLYSLGILIFISYFYGALSDNLDCRLKQLFTMKYQYFLCSRFIAPYYRAFTFIFAIPLGVYFLTSAYSFIWSVKNSERFNLYSGIEFVDNDLNVKGDMAFLFSLLEQYDKLYAIKFSIFLSTTYKEKVEKRISALYVKSLQKKNEEWYKGLQKFLPKQKQKTAHA
ncbi:uncharacterized protein LOC116292684 [Actinia tenebrosa]|uniref:Uncharacterized protein LOC116292684 n=1 Tax=Actinia tenebrosa TaxID=6105 RepID=A0A6P8HHL7_ACTTE|nr:uncharacterized protein LOC116292684 [Actinia tenebrosa]